MSTLYDTWTLHSWSEWLSRRDPASVTTVTVLHVDDHRDLGSPRLFIKGTGWQDPLTNQPVDLYRSATVVHAIESGSLGMGSFFTPFLHAVPTAQVRHLCQPPKAQATQDFRIIPCQEADQLLAPDSLRPAIRLAPTANGTTGSGHYRLTSDVGAWLEEIRPGPILLHIDMDYFNNRYDGDSDWQRRTWILDSSLEEILGKIDELTRALANSGVGSQLEDIVIAYSPGFFPAEYWQTASERLLPALARIQDAWTPLG
ncbi:hypothetical protein [Insolitispirillum peregrinum]|uniref:hypothetical protein n=1 Tax=Insolitispirillum peregrinum TaxID=80876 RepID=UPI0036221ADC